MQIRLSRNLHGSMVIGVLLVHVAMLAYRVHRLSPTIDEPFHLLAGISYWTTGRFDVYNVNPPLARLVGALPVLAMNPKLDAADFADETPRGGALVESVGARIFALMRAARYGCLVFSVLGALGCYLWAKRLWGRTAGLMALFLWCLFPEVLAHGSLMTADVAAAALGVWAGFVFWNWLRTPTIQNAAIAGVILGLAVLTKTTWLVLFLCWPLLWMIGRFADPRREERGSWLLSAGQLVGILVVAIALVNVGYLFQGSFTRLGNYDFLSESMTGHHPPSQPGNRFRGTWLGKIPVPLPRPLMEGLDLQKYSFETYAPAYLRGRLHSGGCWFIYFYAALVKWPLGFWLLLGFSGVLRNTGESLLDAITILALPGLVFAVASWQATPGYFRYVLPALPFLVVWCSRLGSRISRDFVWRSTPILAALVWIAVSSLRCYPHSLSYFNELAGGPKNGSIHLADCNIDWGQDLLALKEWYDACPEARPLRVAYIGIANPKQAGLPDTLPPPRGPKPGWFAVSVNALRGINLSLLNGGNSAGSMNPPSYSYFAHFTPAARAGYSIDIYHITEAGANRVRRELGLPELANSKSRPRPAPSAPERSGP